MEGIESLKWNWERIIARITDERWTRKWIGNMDEVDQANSGDQLTTNGNGLLRMEANMQQ